MSDSQKELLESYSLNDSLCDLLSCLSSDLPSDLPSCLLSGLPMHESILLFVNKSLDFAADKY